MPTNHLLSTLKISFKPLRQIAFKTPQINQNHSHCIALNVAHRFCTALKNALKSMPKHTLKSSPNHAQTRKTKSIQKSVPKSIVIFGIFASFFSLAQAKETHIKTQNEVKEGRDFIVLENPIPNAQNTIIEIFSYSCPFCYRYSKLMPELVKDLPSNVAFKPHHLSKKGDYGNLASQVFAVLIAKDKKANVSIKDGEKSAFFKAQKAYFKAYHLDKERWGQGKNPKAFLHTGLDAAGVKLDDFYAALQDKAVQDILHSWEAVYEIAKIQGIPAFVVNGKYLIYTKSLTSLKDLEYKIYELLKK